jgi:hypothetical protein
MKYYSGNEYISLINIEEDLTINGLTFLSFNLNGNLFVDCKIYLKIYCENRKIDLKNSDFTLINYWIPELNITKNNIKITLLTPKRQRGFIFNIKGKNIRAELCFEYKNLFLNINTSYKLNPFYEINHNNYFNQIIFRFLQGSNLFCLAFDTGKNGKYKIEKNRIILSSEINNEINFNIGIGTEDMAAISSCIHFQRFGFKKFYNELNEWLASKITQYKNNNINKIYNINLFFNYFFTNGKTIDTDELVCVTSRSPEYYVSGAYWDRDCLLWSFPAILMIDKDRAAEMLNYVFKIQGKNFGIHSRQINGNILECGFELDELCAPFIALETYIKETGDINLLKKDYMQEILSKIKIKFFNFKHKKYMLFKTELRPSDDMSLYFYNTYDNVLVWKSFLALEYIYKLSGNKKESKDWKKSAGLLKKDLKKLCINKKNNIISYEFDCRGNYLFYEEPPGSLRLLDFYGFIDNDIRVCYENYLKWSYSKQNKYFYNKNIKESGCEHAKFPWTLSAANSLLTDRYKKSGIDFFKQVKMDNFYACESVDSDTGIVKTGKSFATAAGFIAFAIKNGIKN